MIDKILAPIDSLEWDNTRNAVDGAMKLAMGCEVEGPPELIFLHVFNVRSKISRAERERLVKLKEKKIEEEFELLKEMSEERDLGNIRTITKSGNPSKEIIETAEEEDIDIITIGSGKLHDRSTTGKIHKFFYGSVTEEVIHGAPCSILVAKPETELNRILVPIDSIEWDNTLSGVENAIMVAGGCQVEGESELVLMHVLHSSAGSLPDLREEKTELEKKRIQNEFDKVEKMAKERGIENVRTVVKEGDSEKEKKIHEEIATTADELDVDLIAMGSGKLHDRSAKGRIQKFVYGSVTENVIHETPCSVLVARPLG